MEKDIKKNGANNVTVTKEFLPNLKKQGLWDENDYRNIAKIRGNLVSHIKNVMEKQYTTTQETFDAIAQYYVAKKENLLTLKSITNDGSSNMA